MKKLLLSILMLTAMGLSSCGESEAVATDIESYAKKEGAMIAELNMPYNYDSGQIGADGVNHRIDALSIVGIERYRKFNAGTEVLQNVIAIEFIGDMESVRNFLMNKAYFYTESTSDFNSGIYGGYGKDYIILFADDAIEGKYMIIGGFAKDKNGGYDKIALEL